MKTIIPKAHRILALFCATGFLANCQKIEELDEEASSTESKSSLASSFLSEAPTGAIPISTAIKNPSPGQEITVSGEIMGKSNPFIEGRAMLVLGDPTKLTPCNRIPGDSCETPWDVCCDDPEIISQSIATIQILDEDGKPLKEDLKGAEGIKELSFLTVTGTVAEGSNDKNLLINATGIHVAKESPFKNAQPVNEHGNDDIDGNGKTVPHDHDHDGKPDH